MIECTGFLVGDFMCYRCIHGDDIGGVFVFVEDGDTDNEQYICLACAMAVTRGEPLGKLQLRPGKPTAH